MAKVEAIARKMANLRGLTQQAQVSEALTRTELTLALSEALAARARAEVARRNALADWRLERLAAQARPRRRGPVSRAIEAVLVRLGSLGAALVIARAGVWRSSGRPLFDLRHMAAYARRGPNPDVQPPTLFDQAAYIQHNPDVAAGRRAPLLHYLLSGGAEGRDPHPLFDNAWYRGCNASDVAGSGLTPLEHYLRQGAAAGRDPHPLFNARHYLSQADDVLPGEDPLSHYLRVGWMRGLSPHPLFDPAWYREHYPELGAVQEPLAHFVSTGAAEGRSPGPWFDLAHYVALRGAALPGQANPLVDYLEGGAWLVGEARPGVPTTAYLAARPELAREGLTPLEHWARQAAR